MYVYIKKDVDNWDAYYNDELLVQNIKYFISNDTYMVCTKENNLKSFYKENKIFHNIEDVKEVSMEDWDDVRLEVFNLDGSYMYFKNHELFYESNDGSKCTTIGDGYHIIIDTDDKKTLYYKGKVVPYAINKEQIFCNHGFITIVHTENLHSVYKDGKELSFTKNSSWVTVIDREYIEVTNQDGIVTLYYNGKKLSYAEDITDAMVTENGYIRIIRNDIYELYYNHKPVPYAYKVKSVDVEEFDNTIISVKNNDSYTYLGDEYHVITDADDKETLYYKGKIVPYAINKEEISYYHGFIEIEHTKDLYSVYKDGKELSFTKNSSWITIFNKHYIEVTNQDDESTLYYNESIVDYAEGVTDTIVYENGYILVDRDDLKELYYNHKPVPYAYKVKDVHVNDDDNPIISVTNDDNTITYYKDDSPLSHTDSVKYTASIKNDDNTVTEYKDEKPLSYPASTRYDTNTITYYKDDKPLPYATKVQWAEVCSDGVMVVYNERGTVYRNGNIVSYACNVLEATCFSPTLIKVKNDDETWTLYRDDKPVSYATNVLQAIVEGDPDIKGDNIKIQNADGTFTLYYNDKPIPYATNVLDVERTSPPFSPLD